MKRLTKNQAIRDCKEIWTYIYANHCNKIGYEKGTGIDLDKKYGIHSCPLCSWVEHSSLLGTFVINPKFKGSTEIHCRHYKRVCPLVSQYKKDCLQLDFAGTKYAKDAFYYAVMNLKEE